MTPRPCQRSASSAARSVSLFGGNWRIAQTISPLGSADRARPASRASTVASGAMPCGSNSSGAMRNSASTQPCASASSAASKATRSSAAGLAIAATVSAKPRRYSARLPACARASNQAARPATLSAGAAMPRARSSSNSVATRKAPSRCSCSSTLGSRRAKSAAAGGVGSGAGIVGC